MKRHILSLCALLLSAVFAAGPSIESYALSGRVEEEETAETGYVEDLGIAPEFTLQDLNKQMFVLANFRGRKPVILFFWTTWCVNCRQGIKLLNEMYPQMVKDNFEVLAINVGEPESRVSRFVKANALRFKVLLDVEANVAHSYELIGVPTYVIIDKNGHIRFYDHYFPRDDFKRIGKY